MSSDNPEVTVQSARLTFTPANWVTPQTVTVSAAHDDDAADDKATLTHAVDAANSADEYDTVAGVVLSVAVADDDAGVTVSAANPLDVNENASASYTVVLDAEPASDVVIDVAVSGSDNSPT